VESSEYSDKEMELHEKTYQVPNDIVSKIKKEIPENLNFTQQTNYISITSYDAPWEDGYMRIQMYMDDDYWFWVEVEVSGGNFHYKCDDAEGVLEMFRKEFNSLVPVEYGK
jgi:hypothetical protein